MATLKQIGTALMLSMFTASAIASVSISETPLSGGGASIQISISEVIIKEDADLIKKRVAAFQQEAGDKGYMISLNSVGGDLMAAIEIGKLARKIKAMVMVDSGANCMSSCVFILAGGLGRIVEGQVGIHRPYDPYAKEASEVAVKSYYARLRQVATDFLDSVNIDKNLYDAMMRIPPEQIRILSENELSVYGLSSNDPYFEEASAISEAKKYGISRLEYAKRKALQSERCPYPEDNDISTDAGGKIFLKTMKCYEDVLRGRK